MPASVSATAPAAGGTSETLVSEVAEPSAVAVCQRRLAAAAAADAAAATARGCTAARWRATPRRRAAEIDAMAGELEESGKRVQAEWEHQPNAAWRGAEGEAVWARRGKRGVKTGGHGVAVKATSPWTNLI